MAVVPILHSSNANLYCKILDSRWAETFLVCNNFIGSLATLPFLHFSCASALLTLSLQESNTYITYSIGIYLKI